jgi:hypothetical protein
MSRKLYEILVTLESGTYRLVDLLDAYYLPNGRQDAISTDRKWLEKVAARLDYITYYKHTVKEVAPATS